MQTAVDAVTPFGTHVYTSELHGIATAGSWLIAYSRQPPDAKYFAVWHSVVARVVEQQPGKVSILVIIDSAARSPDESQRKLIAAATQRHAQSIEHFVYVIEGKGFAAAALRSALSLISLATRTPYRQKVFAGVEEAGVWLEQAKRERGPGLDARALSAIVHTMRDKVSQFAAAPAQGPAAPAYQPPVSR